MKKVKSHVPWFRVITGLSLALTVFVGCSAMGGGTIQRAFSKDQKCKILNEWICRIEKEYPTAFST